MLAPNQPRKTSLLRELVIVAVFTSCVAFFGSMGIMTVLPADASADTTKTTQTQEVVRYRELKNLGGGLYLCEVWTQYSVDATIIKLTASEKAKLQRAYIK